MEKWDLKLYQICESEWMTIKQNFLFKEGIRIIGFTGGKGRNFLKDSTKFLPRFPHYGKDRILSQQLIIEYFTDPRNGILEIFKLKWPVLLVLTDIDNIFLENRVINIARDLYHYNFENIFQANLQESIVKRIIST